MEDSRFSNPHTEYTKLKSVHQFPFVFHGLQERCLVLSPGLDPEDHGIEHVPSRSAHSR